MYFYIGMSHSIKQVVFAGGCFWCTEAVFQRVKGVVSVQSGYTGGFIKNPAYREVCEGRTGHAEGVLLSYDESIVTFNLLLEIFFATHDPTTLNRQGNDVGTQYRSEIFYTEESQKEKAVNFIEMLEKEDLFENPIVTGISPLDVFYNAEDYHQDYYNLNKEQPYCSIIINPKLNKLLTNYKDQLK